MVPYDVRLPQPGTRAGEAIYTVVQPDICVICDPGKIEPRGCLGIVEVLSPSTAARDWKDKFDLYEEAGGANTGLWPRWSRIFRYLCATRLLAATDWRANTVAPARCLRPRSRA